MGQPQSLFGLFHLKVFTISGNYKLLSNEHFCIWGSLTLLLINLMNYLYIINYIVNSLQEKSLAVQPYLPTLTIFPIWFYGVEDVIIAEILQRRSDWQLSRTNSNPS